MNNLKKNSKLPTLIVKGRVVGCPNFSQLGEGYVCCRNAAHDRLYGVESCERASGARIVDSFRSCIKVEIALRLLCQTARRQNLCDVTG